ncbi:hypothetical protein FB474_1310 [Oryzihumus leptocrescens]|uniref:Uncharacterized protein n=2 Tax=Oryzihumus leptocrescens TaxID=297536 RepID=A0A542ZHX3_9MICO|nr:hypothetical protein [Oryzihumus leptocrescens]TQL59935.1 hypothetical protein FB474_1310 [Oryzihumus leptocrescens]
MDVADAMDELYKRAPEQFVAHRASLVSRLKESGQVELARQVGTARRPSLAAWAINLVFRSDPGRAQQLAELGRAMREAQAAMEGDRIRELTARRRELVDELTATAATLAGAQGHVLEGTARRELAATLTAALVSDEAYAAATSGVLTRSLSYSGFGDVDVTAATATPLTPARAAATGSTGSTGSADAADAAEPAGAAAGTEAREQARQVVIEAESGVEQRRRELEAAREGEAALSAAVEELHQQLDARRAELARARSRVSEADAALTRAAAVLDSARRAMDRT